MTGEKTPSVSNSEMFVGACDRAIRKIETAKTESAEDTIFKALDNAEELIQVARILYSVHRGAHK